jgi:hypothetical protein
VSVYLLNSLFSLEAILTSAFFANQLIAFSTNLFMLADDRVGSIYSFLGKTTIRP